MLLRKQKAITVFCILILSVYIFGMITPQRVNADSTFIFVDDNNIDGPWDGSQTFPYQNVTSGLEKANSGEILFVFEGVYIENLFLNIKKISWPGPYSGGLVNPSD